MRRAQKALFFWKAEKEGRSIYILGTVHIGVSLDELKCSSKIVNSLKKSKLLWTESNPQQVQQEKTRAVKEVIVDSSGLNFRSLNEEGQNFFKAKQSSYDFMAVQRMSYFGLFKKVKSLCWLEQEKILANLNMVQSRNQEFHKKLDIEIQQIARTHNIRQRYLDQKGLPRTLIQREAKGIYKTHVEKAIRNCSQQEEAIKAFNSAKRMFDKNQWLIQKYKAGEHFNIDEIAKLHLRQKGYPEKAVKASSYFTNHILLRSRNEIWLNKLLLTHLRMMKNTNMFVAAGLGHFLQGSFNPVRYVEKKGVFCKAV